MTDYCDKNLSSDIDTVRKEHSDLKIEVEQNYSVVERLVEKFHKHSVDDFDEDLKKLKLTLNLSSISTHKIFQIL